MLDKEYCSILLQARGCLIKSTVLLQARGCLTNKEYCSTAG